MSPTPPTGAPGRPAPDTSAQAADKEAADAREYEVFAQGQDPLDIEAATWVARRRDGLDAEGEAEFRAWLDEDSRHQAAYDDMDDTFGRLRDMPAGEVDAIRAGLAADETSAATPATTPSPVPQQIRPPGPLHPQRPQAPPRPASPGRRAWMIGLGRLLPQAAAAGAALGIAGTGWLGWAHWRSLPTFGQSYASVRGQQLRVELPDGSHVVLDTATRADVRLYRDRREVQLHEGQALFSVALNTQRPFHVLAGGVRVTVIGTRFSVRHTHTGLTADETRVVVEEGRVRVARHIGTDADALVLGDGEAVTLAAGESMVADGQGRLGIVAAVPSGSAAPWRDGRVNFDNTPLAQALAEFERYGATGVVVRDPAVAALPVGGSFQWRRFDAFLASLPRQLPVRLERRDDETEVVDIRR